MTATRQLRLDRLLSTSAMRETLEADVREGLRLDPKSLPPKWFYDARGSDLFSQITELPEYYPTRREVQILREQAPAIAHVSGADTLIELGSGTSEKTTVLLDALAATGSLRRYVPFDVDDTVLAQAGERIAAAYPQVQVHAVAGDFEHHLAMLPTGGRRLIAFLGGTIGNLDPAQRGTFLSTLAQTMAPGDSLLLGTDLVKSSERLVAAYDDAAGVTAEFNKNVLYVLAAELGADVDPEAFEHVAIWDAKQEWIEMRLRSRVEQVFTVLDFEAHFAAGEELRTEISAKFRREKVAAEVRAAGLTMAHWWTDADGDYALSLSVKPGASQAG